MTEKCSAVLRSRRNCSSDGAERTDDRRAFHARAAVTGKARSPRLSGSRESGEKRRNALRKARARESERCWAGFVFVLVSAGVTQSVGDCYLRLADAEYRPRFCCVAESRVRLDRSTTFTPSPRPSGGTVAEWLACWTLAQKGPG